MEPEFQNVTIDQLAAMMYHGFEELRETINGVDSKVDDLRSEVIPRLDAIDNKIGGVERRLYRIEDKMFKVEAELGIK